MAPKVKEDIEIKGDSRDVSSLEEKDRNFKILEVFEDEEHDVEVDLEGELIAALEELSIDRNKNKILSKKLNEYEDQLEDLCIQLQKVEKTQACNKYDEELASLKVQLEAAHAKEEALGLHIEQCDRHEEIANKVIKDLKLQVEEFRIIEEALKL